MLGKITCGSTGFIGLLEYSKNYSGYRTYYFDENGVADIIETGFYYCLLNSTGDAFSFSSTFTLKVDPNLSDASKFFGGAFVHELGHSLGLKPSTFDGIDSRKYTVEEYPSAMNYNHIDYPQQHELPYSNGGVFSDWGYLQENGFALHSYFYGY